MSIWLAVLIGKLIGFLVRITHKGHASVLPGYIVERFFPSFLRKFQHKHRLKVILITGTNGKTTTSKLVTKILKDSGFNVICNDSGANLPRGIISSIIKGYYLMHKNRWDYGVFEVDEAHLKNLCSDIKPNCIVFLNLFRDQLDRYGEIQKNFATFRETLSTKGLKCKIVINVDDPLINLLSAYQESIGYGIEESNIGSKKLPEIADSKFCPICNTKLDYKLVFYAHMGHYTCPTCYYSRKEPDVKVTDIKEYGIEGSVFTITFRETTLPVRTVLPGLYNVSNVAAGIAVTLETGIPLQKIVASVNNARTAFGRGEKFFSKGRLFYLILVKNPAGYNEVLKMISQKSDLSVLMYLNDKIPDGRDVSWIWDVDFESLRNKVSFLGISGTRCYDLEVRLKYAEVLPKTYFVEQNLINALNKFETNSIYKTNFVLANYSAMIEIRDKIKKKEVLKKVET